MSRRSILCSLVLLLLSACAVASLGWRVLSPFWEHYRANGIEMSFSNTWVWVFPSQKSLMLYWFRWEETNDNSRKLEGLRALSFARFRTLTLELDRMTPYSDRIEIGTYAHSFANQTLTADASWGSPVVDSLLLPGRRLIWTQIGLPFWLLSCICGLWPFYSVSLHAITRSFRRRKGLCIDCGYDLRGSTASTSRVCPECGTPISPSQAIPGVNSMSTNPVIERSTSVDPP